MTRFTFALACLLVTVGLVAGTEPLQVINRMPLTVVNRTATVAAIVPRGEMHAHTCPYCGTSWAHDHSSYGKVADHTCPNCKKVLPYPWTQQTYKAAAPKPTVQSFPTELFGGGCPNGNCPNVTVRRR